jgi:hypothetical protein
MKKRAKNLHCHNRISPSGDNLMSNRGRNQNRYFWSAVIYAISFLRQHGAGFIGLMVFIAVLTYPLYKGNFDRFISNFNKDSVTAKDLVYQTGNVRVYKFQDGKNICYVADKQGLSASIFCN